MDEIEEMISKEDVSYDGAGHLSMYEYEDEDALFQIRVAVGEDSRQLARRCKVKFIDFCHHFEALEKERRELMATSDAPEPEVDPNEQEHLEVIAFHEDMSIHEVAV